MGKKLSLKRASMEEVSPLSIPLEETKRLNNEIEKKKKHIVELPTKLEILSYGRKDNLTRNRWSNLKLRICLQIQLRLLLNTNNISQCQFITNFAMLLHDMFMLLWSQFMIFLSMFFLFMLLLFILFYTRCSFMAFLFMMFFSIMFFLMALTPQSAILFVVIFIAFVSK